MNVAGGIKVDDPGIDLAVCASVVSSLNDIPISDKVCFSAEIGLGGELRAVNKIEKRILEADKLGFKEVLISSFGKLNSASDKSKIKVSRFSKLNNMISHILG